MPEYDFVAGERIGTLEDALKILSGQIQRKRKLDSKIRKTVIYTAIIILAMIVSCVVVLIVVAPQLAELSKELGIVLTPTAGAIISAGNFMAENWHWLLFSIFWLLVLFLAAFRIKLTKRIMHVAVLRAPIISGIAQKTNSAYLMRTLSSLLAAGVPVEKSLEISSCVLGNICFKKAAETAAERAENGQKLFEALRNYENLLPPLSLQMIETGEEKGESPIILAELADFFEDKAIDEAKNLTDIIEPGLMLIFGTAAGFFVVSTIQPIYSLLKIIR